MKVEKAFMLQELVKLEELVAAKDMDKILESVHPYLLTDVIEYILNSTEVENPVDYTTTGEDAKQMVADIKSGKLLK